MAIKKFYLVGEGDASNALDIDISDASDLESLKLLIAGQFAITVPDGISLNVGLEDSVS